MIVDRLEASDAAMRVAQLRVLGGTMGRVPVEATAFAHRRSRIMANLAAALKQENSGAYVNFLADGGEAWVRTAYPGPTWDRLRAIKGRYDPTNLFHLNQNIPPAAIDL
jgi:hypothetical protein